MAVINGDPLGLPTPDILVGTADDDTINGLGAADVLLSGGGGNDTINGGEGDDLILRGEDGNDTIDSGDATPDVLEDVLGLTLADLELLTLLDGGAGNDVLIAAPQALIENFNGGDGIDTADFSNRNQAVNVDLEATGITIIGLQVFETITGVENVIGSDFDDVLLGSALDNELTGGLGNDELDGRSGNDTISGGGGADRASGGGGDDSLAGGIGDDALYGGVGSDLLQGGGGDDRLRDGAGQDQLFGADGNDDLAGGDDADVLEGGAGNDRLSGQSGNDSLTGGDGDDVLSGGLGADDMAGGGDDDSYKVDNAGDTVTEAANAGFDRVTATIDYTLTANVENLQLGSAARVGTGNALDNTIFGSGGGDTVSGLAGNDVLRGRSGGDTLLGGDGLDVLDGGAGRDTMTGGEGRDRFQFRDGDMLATRPVADRITDFSQADNEKIDLDLLDANTVAAGDQAFVFIGNGAFTGVAGQLHYAHQSGSTYIEGDTNGDGTADFVIALTGTINLAATDLVL